MKAKLIYLLVVLVSYILSALALFIDKGLMIMGLLFCTPLIILMVSILNGKRYKFDIVFPIAVGVLFLPFIIYPYNDSALIYSLIYACVSIIGQMIGRVIVKFQ